MRSPALVRVGAFGLLLALGCASSPDAELTPLRAAAIRSLENGRSAFAERRWSNAARSFGSAADTFAAVDEIALEASARRDQAEALRRVGDFAGAEIADTRALTIDRHLGRADGEAQDLAGLARDAAATARWDVAIGFAEEASTLARADARLLAILENDLALYRLQRGGADDRARAEALLASALAANLAAGDARGVATNRLNQARAALLAGDLDAATSRLADALTSYRALEDPEGIAAAQELAAAVAAAAGDAATARFHREQARAAFTFLEDRAGLARIDAAEAATP